MNTNIRNEVLTSIDFMNDVVQESEMEVLCSLMNQMDKASTILESYNGAELDIFAIYQEADGAVQQGDPSGEANAEAKKKNIFVKIWEFIKNVVKSIGAFIKKCWNGTVVPTVEAVTDQAGDIIDKITGKDESWIRNNAVAIGISGASVLAACISFVTINKELNQEVASFAKVLQAMGFSILSGGALGAAVGWTFTKSGAKTSIAVPTLCGAINAILGVIITLKSQKKLSALIEARRAMINGEGNMISMKDMFLEEPKEYDFNTIEMNLSDTKKKIVDLADDSFTISTPGEGEGDVNKDEGNEAAKSMSIFQKIILAAQKLINKILEGLGKIKNIFKTIREGGSDEEAGSSDNSTKALEFNGDTGSTESSESTEAEVSDAEAAEAEAEESKPKNATGETGQTNVGEPSKGMSYTANQVKVFLNNVGKTDVEVPENPEGKKMIRYKDGDPLTFVYHPDDGQYYYESAEEDVNDDDDVVTESHTGYYFK